jgi:NhaP-type Na+/H+ or K+/H+ antiporter
LVRAIVLFVFSGKDILPQLFLAPRGLITILLFFAIPKEFAVETDFQGVLLFVILVSCLVMSWSLMQQKKKLAQIEEYEEGGVLGEEDSTIEVGEN